MDMPTGGRAGPGELSGRLLDALLASDALAVGDVLRRALESMSPLECAEELMGPTLNAIGEGWSNGEVALAQLYYAGRICEEQIGELLPGSDLVRAEGPRLGIGVLADHHVLGKRIVVSFLRLAGYAVRDYGAGLSPETLAELTRQDDLQGLLVSTLMLPSALKVGRLTRLLRDHPVKVFVGGAPFIFDPGLWQSVGADGMGRSAADALALVQRLEGQAP